MNAKACVSKELNTKHTKILEGLLKMPENKLCADCKCKGPRWASVNLGLFICLQCSGIHRSLGVHISQVRSTTLDTWLPEQVAFMQKMGNEKANSYWEAELPPNHDRDGIAAFIHLKYRDKRWIPRDGKLTLSSPPPPKLEEDGVDHEVSFGNRPGSHAAAKSPSAKKYNHAPKVPSAKSEKRSIAAIVRSRNRSAGSASCFRLSTQKPQKDRMRFSDKSVSSTPSFPSNQQQVHPHHHQDHHETAHGISHQRSVSDSYALNGTITTQSWVNFDYDEQEDALGQWYSGSSNQMENKNNSSLSDLGTTSDYSQAFSPNSSESFVSADETIGDGSGVIGHATVLPHLRPTIVRSLSMICHR